VVNEAMAAGLPILLSERCGCAPELLEAGVNGFLFDPASVPQLSGLMKIFDSLEPSDRELMGTQSRRIVAAILCLRGGPPVLRSLDGPLARAVPKLHASTLSGAE